MEEAKKPVLYILMRSDMDSLNAGKMAAQATHAANCAVGFIKEHFKQSVIKDLFEQWENSTTQYFGTCIVLDIGNLENMKDIVENIRHTSAFVGSECSANFIIDPSYPVRDGETIHHLSVVTCGYVFCDANDTELKKILGNLPLYP